MMAMLIDMIAYFRSSRRQTLHMIKKKKSEGQKVETNLIWKVYGNL